MNNIYYATEVCLLIQQFEHDCPCYITYSVAQSLMIQKYQIISSLIINSDIFSNLNILFIILEFATVLFHNIEKLITLFFLLLNEEDILIYSYIILP